MDMFIFIYSGMRGVVDYTNYDDMKYAVGVINLYLFAC